MSCRRCATRRRRYRQTGPATQSPPCLPAIPLNRLALAHRSCLPSRERAALHLARAPNDGPPGLARPGAGSHSRGEQLPLTWHALQRGGAPGLERDPRARDEVAHRARHEDLAAGGLVSHTSADVYGEAADVVATHLTLARVQPGAHVEAERPAGLTDGVGAA